MASDSNLILKGSGNFAGTGNAIANIIVGNADSNSLSGRDGDDHLYGVAGSDRLVGGSGADRLYGGSGDDTLRGSGGKDYLIGGTGADKFILTDPSFSKPGAASQDVILDFSKSEGDRIDVSGIDANALVAGNQAFRFIGTNAFTGTSGELHTFKQSEAQRIRVSASRSRRRNSVEQTRWSGRKRTKRQLQRAWHRSCYMEISGPRFSPPSITYRVAKLPQRQFQVDHHQND